MLTRANLQVIMKKKRKRKERRKKRKEKREERKDKRKEGRGGEIRLMVMPGLVNKPSPSSIMITVLEWAFWATQAKGKEEE